MQKDEEFTRVSVDQIKTAAIDSHRALGSNEYTFAQITYDRGAIKHYLWPVALATTIKGIRIKL